MYCIFPLFQNKSGLLKHLVVLGSLLVHANEIIGNVTHSTTSQQHGYVTLLRV